jgi:hypothetical protein
MYVISYKTLSKGEVIEEGFDTSLAYDMEHAVADLDSIIDPSEDIDEIEIKILKGRISKGIITRK